MNFALLKKITFSILTVLVGCVFIISAIAKMPTMEQLGWNIVETTFLNWTLAEWLVRLLVGIEFFLGVLFIAHFKIKKIAIPISIFLLGVFSIYLAWVFFTYGNQTDCGCFGEMIKLTPLESLIKNGILLALIGIIYFLQREWTIKYSKTLAVVLLLICVAIPIYFLPPESIYIYDTEATLNKPTPLSYLYNSKTNKSPLTELRKGKHIIAFLSLTCSHCRKAAKKIRVMKSDNKSLPFFAILNGDTSNLKTFFDDTRMNNIDYSHFNGTEEFIKMSGGTAFPKIRMVEDTTVYKDINYVTMNEKDIEKWLKK